MVQILRWLPLFCVRHTCASHRREEGGQAVFCRGADHEQQPERQPGYRRPDATQRRQGTGQNEDLLQDGPAQDSEIDDDDSIEDELDDDEDEEDA